MTGAAPRPRRTRDFLLSALLLALAALLCALGSWQLQRRAWKLDLIARVDQRVHAEATPAPGRALWPQVDEQHDEYRRVSLQGTWLHSHSTWVTAATELGSGYWLMTPLRQADGSVVWVNRGYVSPATRAHWVAGPDAPARVTGLLRLSETGRRWLRRNDPAAERWYARDVQALSARRGLGPTAPYFVDAAAAPGDAGEPVGGLTVVRFPNNHLLYALTWYALAALAAWGAYAFWRAPPPSPAECGDESGDNRQLN